MPDAAVDTIFEQVRKDCNLIARYIMGLECCLREKRSGLTIALAINLTESLLLVVDQGLPRSSTQ
jgi:hypothetical protein